MALPKKKISDQASAGTQKEDKEWKLVGCFVNFKFNQVAKSRWVEAVVAQRCEFVLYS